MNYLTELADELDALTVTGATLHGGGSIAADDIAHTAVESRPCILPRDPAQNVDGYIPLIEANAPTINTLPMHAPLAM